MAQQLAQSLKKATARAPEPVRRRILRPIYRAYRRLFRHQWRRDEPTEYDNQGLAIPPLRLRRMVGGGERERPSTETWLETGETDARLIRDLVERNDRPMDEMAAILDFGCGCGRVARWWADLDGPQIFGCDYNRTLTDWCVANLSFLTVATNNFKPPLPSGNDSFDLIYAISVFSHLTEEAQHKWMADLSRVLRPGGLVLFTVHGWRFAAGLPDGERERFEQGELIVRSPELAGSNTCAAFHPRTYVVDSLLARAGLALVESVHETPSSVPLPASPMPLQDNYLAVRRP